MAVIEMTKRMREALIECRRYKAEGRQYFFRVSSMKKLEALGLVKQGYRGISATKRWEPTPAGNEYLISLGRSE